MSTKTRGDRIRPPTKSVVGEGGSFGGSQTRQSSAAREVGISNSTRIEVPPNCSGIPTLSIVATSRRDGRMSATAIRLAFLKAYADDTWTMVDGTYSSAQPRFGGPPSGPTFPIFRMPTKTTLFA